MNDHERLHLEFRSSLLINEIFRRDFYGIKFSQLLTSCSDNIKYFLISNHLNDIKISILNEQNIIDNFTLDLPQFENSIIVKACSTSLNSIIVLFTSDNLYFINSKNGAILNSKDLTKQDTDIEYFLSPTNIPINNFYTLTSIENTDNLLMLDNIGNIHYIEYIFKFNEIKNFKSSHFKFNSLKVNKNLLLAHELNESKLVCFDLNQVLCDRSFKTIYFTIDLNKDEYLSNFGLSLENTYAYTIENKKKFKFYQFEKIDQKFLKVEKTAELMLYAEVTSVLGARDFISFGMKDRKVVSFLIGDKNNLESTYGRIKSLPSRGEPSEEIKRINKLISNELINALDDSSDEDDVDLILDEENSQFKNVREKIKNSTKYTEIKEFSQKNISTNLETLETNWLINFIKTNIDASFDNEVKNKNDNNLLMEDLESNYLNETKRQIFDQQELYQILSNSSKNSFNTKNTGHSVLVSNNYSSQSCSIQ
ncbi:unnamed protein product [Brachionus calyciflorus]|uniref:Uncharacterized protein n=1 Tax=Brachionus calyciflorus TaxID=104777 RepID=A0A813MCB2_9BILA|nr:unnamed protein product [Brachionus calyciflorus]